MVAFYKQKTAYAMRIIDWSSDVCYSDLRADIIARLDQRRRVEARGNVDDAILDRAVARDEHDERLVRRQGHEGELLQPPLILGHEDEAGARRQTRPRRGRLPQRAFHPAAFGQARLDLRQVRPEEGRVGKEG